MIGAYPIGTFPYGRVESDAGVAIVSLEFAEATTNGNDIQPLVALGLGNAEGVASPQDIVLKQLTTLGFAEAIAEPLTFAQKVSPELGFATAIASGQVPIPLIRFKIGRASATVDALDLTPKVDLTLGTAEAIANGISTDIGIETTEAAAIASALDGDATFFIEDIPDIVVTRSADLTQAVLKVLNDEVGNVNIYRADDHRALFSKVATNQTSPYTDTGLDPAKNFKYKATFVILATKGGQSVEVEGGKSEPRYTIGNNKL